MAAAHNAVLENWPKCLVLFCSAKLSARSDPEEKAGREVTQGAGPFVSILLNGFFSKKASSKELNFISADRGGWINVFLVSVLSGAPAN